MPSPPGSRLATAAKPTRRCSDGARETFGSRHRLDCTSSHQQTGKRLVCLDTRGEHLGGKMPFSMDASVLQTRKSSRIRGRKVETSFRHRRHPPYSSSPKRVQTRQSHDRQTSCTRTTPPCTASRAAIGGGTRNTSHHARCATCLDSRVSGGCLVTTD